MVHFGLLAFWCESGALPNVDNPESYHSYEVDNGKYCDAVDMVRNLRP